YFYWDQPAKSRIHQVLCGVDSWDSRPYHSSVDIVFCDACDMMPGMASEVFQALSLLKPGGVLFRHDYGTARGVTSFWNWLARQLPAFQIQASTLPSLRLDPPVYEQPRNLLSLPLFADNVHLPVLPSGASLQ